MFWVCGLFIIIIIITIILFYFGRRMFVSVWNKDKERRIGYCFQPLQLLQAEVTGGLTE